MVEIKETKIEEVLKVHKNVAEFDGNDTKKDYFEERYKDKTRLILVAYCKNQPAGYIVGYDRYEDGSFYCWMAGVDTKYRRIGILTRLMDYQINWARNKGYNTLKIKTRNNKREMLGFLVKNGFYFTSVEQKKNIEENRINLEKKI